MPIQPVTLTPEQIALLNRKLGELRHDANNHVALMIAAIELIRRKPSMASNVADSLADHPQKLTDGLREFAELLQGVLGITRD